MNLSRAAWTPFLLISLAATTRAAPAGPLYTLKPVAGGGDVETDSSDFQIDFAIGTPNGKPLIHMGNHEQERFVQTVLEAKDEAPTALRRNYQLFQSEATDLTTGMKTEKHSLQGKTVTIRRGAGGVEVDSPDGDLSDHDRDKLKDVLDNATREMYPAHAVSPGDTWTNPLQDFKKSFPGAQSAQVAGTFVDVERSAGFQCARLHLQLTAKGKLPGTAAGMTLLLSGDVLYALGPQRPLSVSLKGPIAIDGQSKIMGIPMRTHGSGTGTFSMRADKIAGKPLPHP